MRTITEKEMVMSNRRRLIDCDVLRVLLLLYWLSTTTVSVSRFMHAPHKSSALYFKDHSYPSSPTSATASFNLHRNDNGKPQQKLYGRATTTTTNNVEDSYYRRVSRQLYPKKRNDDADNNSERSAKNEVRIIAAEVSDAALLDMPFATKAHAKINKLAHAHARKRVYLLSQCKRCEQERERERDRQSARVRETNPFFCIIIALFFIIFSAMRKSLR